MGSEADADLEMLKMRKLLEIRRKLKEATAAPKPPHIVDNWAIVGAKLVGRGREVLEAAKAQYPTETEFIVKQLADLIVTKKLDEPLTGDVLFALFRRLGLNLRLETKIVFSEHGKVKSLAEKLMDTKLT
ncbi:MAG: double-stranded DNA-binding protein [Candidatus Bathyarchaeia archaeon]